MAYMYVGVYVCVCTHTQPQAHINSRKKMFLILSFIEQQWHGLSLGLNEFSVFVKLTQMTM